MSDPSSTSILFAFLLMLVGALAGYIASRVSGVGIKDGMASGALIGFAIGAGMMWGS
jgi:hypothetical protein